MKAVFAMLALLSGSAFADDLGDADKLLEARDYARALPIYTKLAAAGNAAAQYHLGEMYWYGEGVAADSAKGDEWFRKADQAGYPEAKAALGMTAQRQARMADIGYYVQRYDGADVALSHFNCVKPEIPARSETARDIKSVGAGIDTWMDCYDRFVKNLESMLPVGKGIPADLSNLMTDAELEQATLRMNRAYASVNAAGKQEADQMVAARSAWRDKTEEYVTTNNTLQAITERERAALLQSQAQVPKVIHESASSSSGKH